MLQNMHFFLLIKLPGAVIMKVEGGISHKVQPSSGRGHLEFKANWVFVMGGGNERNSF